MMGWGKFIGGEIGRAAGKKVRDDYYNAKKESATDKQVRKFEQSLYGNDKKKKGW